MAAVLVYVELVAPSAPPADASSDDRASTTGNSPIVGGAVRDDRASTTGGSPIVRGDRATPTGGSRIVAPPSRGGRATTTGPARLVGAGAAAVDRARASTAPPDDRARATTASSDDRVALPGRATPPRGSQVAKRAPTGGLPVHPVPHPSSLAALAAGRAVARSWGATLYAAVIVHDAAHSLGPDTTGQIVGADEVAGLGDLDAVLGRAGADKVLAAMTDAPVDPLWASVGAAWTGVLDHLRPRLVLFGAHAPATAELGARTGARIGARLLPHARAVGVVDVELRDRDGGYVRLGDSGASVALIADAVDEGACDDDVDLVVLATPGAAEERARVELAGTQPAQLAHAADAIVALGDDALDPGIVASAYRLAELIGGYVVGSPAAAAAGAVPHAAAFERNAPLAPDLCIALGSLGLDLAGATSIIRIGPTATTKLAEGALTGPIANGVEELIRALEERRA